MRKRLSSLVALSLACTFQPGCGDAAAQRSAFNDAIEKIDVAERGFVPASPEGEGPSLASYRQTALADAGETLQTVIKSGTPGQQVGAHRLQAAIHASAARHAAQQAAAHYARLAPQAVQDSGHAVAAHRAQVRVEDQSGDQTPLLESLRETFTQQKKRQAELTQQKETLTKELETRQAERGEIQKRRDAAAVEAARLRNQAFISEGEEQFRLQEDAATAEREGTLAAAEMARKQLDIDMLNSRLGVLTSQLQLADRLLTDLQTRIDQTQARQAEVEQGTAAAQEAREEQLQILNESFTEIYSQFKSQVDARLDTAAAQTQQAVAGLQAALAAADGDNRSVVQLDLLGAYATRAEILVEHLRTLASFQDILQLVANSAGDQAGAFEQWIAEIQGKRAELAQLAATTIEDARGAAQQAMAGANMNLAQERAQLLEAYAQQLQKIQSAT